MKKEMTWREAITQVLAEAGTPLHYQDITERISAQGLRTRLGATPAATVTAQIAVATRQMGKDSPFFRVSRGIYTLNPKVSISKVVHDATDASDTVADEEEQYAIISSFGMFWRRMEVDWVKSPKLMGRQMGGSVAVDFSGQTGVYLLYDGREVIYVGRAMERSIGKRLAEHTTDRMAARWDRFSWFGLKPVSEKGQLGDMPDKLAADKLIPALEAILIEALEPRQNRKRGDDLSAVEYIQELDSKVAKQKLASLLESI